MSYAQFENPCHKAIQDGIVLDVKAQQLGTVALLHLELAMKLDLTEGAKDGIDVMVS